MLQIFLDQSSGCGAPAAAVVLLHSARFKRLDDD